VAGALAPERSTGPAEPAAGGATCRYLAIIMDGNGRWAQGRGLRGRRAERAQALRRGLEHALDLGIEEVTVYSFSTENWNRPRDEVEALMQLFIEMIDSQVPDMHERGARVRFVGRREGAPDELVRRIEEAEALTAANTRMTLYIAFGYGGRQSARRGRSPLAAEGPAPAFTEDDFRRHLYAPDARPGAPDPHLELRISNFLLWQCAYAGCTSATGTGGLRPEDLDAALADYAGRQRRFGGRGRPRHGRRAAAGTPADRRDDAHHHRRRPRRARRRRGRHGGLIFFLLISPWPCWARRVLPLTRKYRPLPLAASSAWP
jgi:undecaprenyl diphosphate synthase